MLNFKKTKPRLRDRSDVSSCGQLLARRGRTRRWRNGTKVVSLPFSRLLKITLLNASLRSDDFRVFCGDLGNEVSDEVLGRAFSRYPSFQKAKVIRDKRTNKTRGFGFVSFKDPNDFVKAIREMNGEWSNVESFEFLFFISTSTYSSHMKFYATITITAS